MKKSLIITLLTACITIFTVVPLCAYTISGYIQYISDVTVTLGGDASKATVTDSNGYYEFSGLQEGGSYTIVPSKGPSVPSVDITSPESNNSLKGNVTISADIQTDYCAYAFDPSQLIYTSLDSDQNNQNFQVLATSCCFIITEIDLYIDNILEHTETSSAMCRLTWTYTWNTTGFSNGQHIIKLVVTDETQSQGSADVPIIINNDSSMALIGDVNLDSNVNIVDALLIAQYYVGLSPSVFNSPVADVNLDDTVNIIDALLVARYYVGLLTELPEEKPGGYGQIPLFSENVLKAYDFLAAGLSSTQPDVILKDIVLAFSQVVAGANYRLVCNYHLNTTNSDHYLSSVIFFNTEMIPEQISSLKLDIY